MSFSLPPKNSIALQWSLLCLCWMFFGARIATRIFKGQRNLLISDVWAGLAAIDVLCLVLVTTLIYSQGGMSGMTSVSIRKMSYAGNYFYDVGMYFPKFSLLAFYFQIIPTTFERSRWALVLITIFISAAAVCTFFTDTFWCGSNISINWSTDSPTCATYLSYSLYYFNWSLNFSSELMVFALPLPLLQTLKKVSRAEKIGVAITFMLGIITMSISIVRFTAIFYPDLQTSIYNWSCAEVVTATIVISLPALRPLITSSIRKIPLLKPEGRYSVSMPPTLRSISAL